ncbi:MAG: type II toxin-antitoxin system HipA family toxin [Rubrivivax sp.]|nr:type II toxin-antitoxin system HipA family toxin [Rubrivivax sp.]
MLPERIRQLDVEIAGPVAGQLLKHSVYEFRYLRADDPGQPALSLVVPPTQPTYQDGDLFPVMEQNLPEGDLYMRLRAMFPKQPLTPMHLLALVGSNGIGRLGFRLPDTAPAPPGRTLDRAALLATNYTPEVFGDLVAAYLATGAGIAGMQPKIMVPDRPTVPIPTLIVKAASDAYPGLAANEFLCLSAARRARIEVPGFELSHDGQMLVLDRFDLREDGSRLGFEDIAALMGMRVRDTQSDRKYQGSYQNVAALLKAFRLPAASLERLFEQLALTVMVRNGDGHLKNFGVLYTSEADARLAPLFDVVTTSIYRYRRYDGGPELEDRTLALKLFAGKGQTKAYPTAERLLEFGRRVCGVAQPATVLQRIASAMHETLQAARTDERIPKGLLASMADVWEQGMVYANEPLARVKDPGP